MKPAYVGNFELGALIARGGVGQIHAARDPDGRSVVVKRLRDTLSPDPRMRKRLGEEKRVSQQVSHRNVIRTLEYDCDADDSPFIVMDHARGITLRQLIDDTGPLPLARVRMLALQLFDGLTAIHDAGIVHADLTSSNIIVGEADHLTIIDFGLARTKLSPTGSGEALVCGTPEFMAPELFGGATPSIASDIYAVGIIIYEMLAGATPFCGASSMQILQRQMTDTVTFPASVGALEGVLRRALDRDVADRFDNVHAFVVALAGATPGLPEDAVIQSWRDQLLEALASPSAQPIIAAYSGLADALIAADRMLDAIVELEDALEMLIPATGLAPPALWRISLLLAAMCGRLGIPGRARELAMNAHDQATRAGDRGGIERSCWLLGRLTRAHGTIDPTTTSRAADNAALPA
jgi:serine/threonine-protein kinase